MGKPLIAADSVGTREPVVPGRNGFLHRPKDSRDLADQMLKILSLSPEECARLGRESRALAIERFEERIVIDKYLEAVAKFRRPVTGVSR